MYNAVRDQRMWLFGRFVPITFQDSVCQSAWILAVCFVLPDLFKTATELSIFNNLIAAQPWFKAAYMIIIRGKSNIVKHQFHSFASYVQ